MHRTVIRSIRLLLFGVCASPSLFCMYDIRGVGDWIQLDEIRDLHDIDWVDLVKTRQAFLMEIKEIEYIGRRYTGEPVGRLFFGEHPASHQSVIRRYRLQVVDPDPLSPVLWAEKVKQFFFATEEEVRSVSIPNIGGGRRAPQPFPTTFIPDFTIFHWPGKHSLYDFQEKIASWFEDESLWVPFPDGSKSLAEFMKGIRLNRFPRIWGDVFTDGLREFSDALEETVPERMERLHDPNTEPFLFFLLANALDTENLSFSELFLLLKERDDPFLSAAVMHGRTWKEGRERWSDMVEGQLSGDELSREMLEALFWEFVLSELNQAHDTARPHAQSFFFRLNQLEIDVYGSMSSATMERVDSQIDYVLDRYPKYRTFMRIRDRLSQTPEGEQVISRMEDLMRSLFLTRELPPLPDKRPVHRE